MHVLQIYKDYWPVLGGIENHLRLLAEGLAARGHRVTVLTVGRQRRTTVAMIGGVRVIYAGRLATVSSAPLSPRLPLLLARERPDILHLHMPDPTGDIAQTLARRAPLVITYHSDIVRQRRMLALYAPLLRRTLRRAARIIATSPNYVQSSALLRPLAERCTVIPFGVAAEAFAPADPARVAALRARFSGPIVLFVGRLRTYKGIDRLVHAMADVPGHAIIVGADATMRRAELERLAAQLGISNRVHCVGAQDAADLRAFYALADVFVLPSIARSEAFGIAQIEAQAAGLPIVTTELGTGTSYVTRHGVTGFVVPPDHVPALAQALRVLIANPDLARALGAAGKQRAWAEFRAEVMLDRYEQVYAGVMNDRAKEAIP
jgi:rhamnosyl/mannosyltransferase